jgi:hypothetical protein
MAGLHVLDKYILQAVLACFDEQKLPTPNSSKQAWLSQGAWGQP